MAVAVAPRPLAYAEPDTRIDYLKRVGLLTLGGLSVSAVTGFLSALAVAFVPLLQNQIASLVIILGSYAIANFVARSMVFSGGSAKWLGFGMGAVFQGIAMGYLLLAAVAASAAATGQPFALIGQALVATALTSVGMLAYLWTKPRELSMIRAGLSMLFLPMLLLMGVSFVFPGLFGGPLGLVLAAVFVVVSAAGLLYQMNVVLRELRTDMHVEGAYLVTMGILILYWNILTLLMRLNRR